MTAYHIIKSLDQDHYSCLVRSGVIPLPVTTKILIYEYYLAVYTQCGCRHGDKLKAKRETAKKYRVSIPTVDRAISFCEG